MSYHYALYGLSLRTPFRIPYLPPASVVETADVTVEEGWVPLHLEGAVATDEYRDAEPGRYLFRGGRRSGRFLVEGGGRVVVRRNLEADETILASHFLTSVMAAVLRHRGLLVLHANAAATDSGVVVIAGGSGCGKSTTLAGVISRGASMLSDDLTAMPVGTDGDIQALPGIPLLHLRHDAVQGLGYWDNPPGYSWKSWKVAVSIQSPEPRSVTLASVHILHIHQGNELLVKRLTGTRCFSALEGCLYGPTLPSDHRNVLPMLSRLARQVPVYAIGRPNAHWTLDSVVDLISSHIRTA